MRVYDEYEKRFAKARLDKPFRRAYDEGDRERIRSEVKRMLAYDESLVPRISNFTEISKKSFDGYDVSQIKYNTWDNFIGVASLYVPHGVTKPPLVFIFCGHGKEGRLSPSYVAMAKRLVELKIAVIVPDNIGQGDRKALGHYDAIAPFYCGLTLQGLIVMESIALIRYMKNDGRFDSSRFGSCGNSGGGTLNLFLAALAPEISALSASGYPSEFAYIFSKERYHCACNLLPGCAHTPEMWEILSLFAPKPMLLECGLNDALIPVDYAHRNSRKVKYTYERMGAGEKFRYVSCNTIHSWFCEDRYEIAKFFSEVFKTKAPETEEREELKSEEWHIRLGDDPLTVNRLSELLTGITVPESITLADIFKPKSRGALLKRESIIPDIGRGEVMRILAQMECALTDPNDLPLKKK